MIFNRLKQFFRKPIIVTTVMVTFLIGYYLLFINRGIVLGDEGYSAHIAERILQGQIPYKDFFLQYPPGYFYLLATLYKLFGISLIPGRLLSLMLCLGVFLAALALLRAFGITSNKARFLTLLSIAAFGYPLINIPIVVWPTVLITELIMLALLRWFQTPKWKHLLYIGILLALLFLIKQNVALVQTIMVNFMLLFSTGKNYRQKLLAVLFVNTVWIIPTFSWVYLFFIHNNLRALSEFLVFNRRYIDIYPMSYPPLSFLLQPLGFLKLLPYYLPIVFLLLLLLSAIRKNATRSMIVFLLPLAGFFTTIYPTSDLLHVYPFFGVVLVTFIVFIRSQLLRFQKVFFLILLLCIISGFYLTLFREYYRYQAPYRFQTVPLDLPRTKGIFIDQDSEQSIQGVSTFIDGHTRPTDYIFVYSFSPMLYFLLERPNPSRYSIYYPGYLTTQQEKATLHDIQNKHVTYIVTDGPGNLQTPLAKWIDKQKKLEEFGAFTIFAVR